MQKDELLEEIEKTRESEDSAKSISGAEICHLTSLHN